MQNILIIGDGITALGIINGLKNKIKNEEIKVHLVSNNPETSVACKSKYIEDIFKISSKSNEFIDKIIKISEKFINKPILLIGGDDTALEKISKLHEKVSRHAIVTFPNWEKVQKVIHKEITNEIALDLRIPALETVKINNTKNLEKFIQNGSFDFPLFLKAKNSEKLLEKYKTKGIIVNSIQELQKAYEIYDEFFGEMLIQKYLSGNIDEIFAVLLVLDKNGRVIAASSNKKIRSARKFGSTTLSKSLYNIKIINDAIKLAKNIGYYGVLGVQFKFDPDDKKYKLLEINGRFSVSTPLAYECGQNIAENVVDIFSGKILEDYDYSQRQYKDGISLWFPIDDIKLIFEYKFLKNPIKYLKPILGSKVKAYPLSITDPKPMIFLLKDRLFKLKNVFK